MSDITALKRMLADRAREVAAHLLPAGKLEAREWCVGSVAGEPGSSLKVHLDGHKAGLWSDFAPGGPGGDLIDLWMLVKAIPLVEALDQIRAFLGVQAAPRFDKPEKSWKRPEKPRCHAPKSDVLAYLTGERKISRAAIKAFRVGEDGRTMIFPLILPDGELANVKYRAIDRDGTKQPMTRAEPNAEPVLFGWQALPENTREVTICEGEIDALTLFDYGVPALSVPFGGGVGRKQQWIESEFERLERFEKIFLALDQDAEGESAAQEIANRLGRHRCVRVRLPFKDANDCRKNDVSDQEIAACFAEAEGLDPPELRRAGDFSNSVVKLFWPADDAPVGYRMPFARIGTKLLFRPGELTIWTGASGSGKSQLLSHASVAWGDQGSRVCIASLEMAAAQFLRRMVKQAGNTDRPPEDFIRELMNWLNDWVFIFDFVGKSTVSKLIEVFEYARARYGCDTFIVDSLMRLGVGSEDYEGQEKAVFQLVNWTVEKGVHTHLVAHSRKPQTGQQVPETEDIKGAGEIAFNAFNILTIWRNRKLEDDLREAGEKAEKGDLEAQDKFRDLSGRPPVILNVAKQRNGDWEGKTGLWFNQLTYQYRSIDDNPNGITFMHKNQEKGEVAWLRRT